VQCGPAPCILRRISDLEPPAKLHRLSLLYAHPWRTADAALIVWLRLVLIPAALQPLLDHPHEVLEQKWL
jgi:hypothetical protein